MGNKLDCEECTRATVESRQLSGIYRFIGNGRQEGKGGRWGGVSYNECHLAPKSKETAGKRVGGKQQYLYWGGGSSRASAWCGQWGEGHMDGVSP